SSEQIASDLRKKLADIPGVVIRTRPGQGLFIFRMFSGGNTDQLQIELRGYDLTKARELMAKIQDDIKDIPGITDIQASSVSGKPEEIVVIDREKAADLQVPV